MGAIGRLIKAVWYAITFQFDKLTNTLRTKESVIRATYAGIADKQTAQIQTAKTAVAGLMRFKATKEVRLSTIAEEIKKQNTLIAGAASKAKMRVDQLQAQGKTMDEIRQDAEYQRCQRAFTDFSSTLRARQEEASHLDIELAGLEKGIADNKLMLETMLRELDKIKQEGEETVADVTIAKQKKEIADLMSGISVDTTSQERQAMQSVRQQIRAEADISQQLAGLDTKKAEQDFAQYAAASEANTEFERLLGLAVPATAVPAMPVGDGKLPE